MTLDELLADLKAKHGEGWIHSAVWLPTQVFVGSPIIRFDRLEITELVIWLGDMATAGVAATWEPGLEVWASLPQSYWWICANPDGHLVAWAEKPTIYPDGWWHNSGKRRPLNVVAPDSVAWKLACWKRPEAQL